MLKRKTKSASKGAEVKKRLAKNLRIYGERNAEWHIDDNNHRFWVGICAICTFELDGRKADPCHKYHRGEGKKDDPNFDLNSPRNMVPGHRMCHGFMDARASRKDTMKASDADCMNGRQVKLTHGQRKRLNAVLSGDSDKINLPDD